MKRIFDYLPARIFSYYHEANQILKGVMPLPRMLNFMPSALCNHSCPGCDFASINQAKYVMPTNDWQKIFNELHQLNSIKFIEFGGLGEPMLHPDFHDMVKKAGEYGWIIGLLTNGTRLKGEVLTDLIKNSAYIRISMESGTEKTFNKIKSPLTEEDGFNSVCENIKEAVRLRNEINPNCNIGYKFTVGKGNHDDMEIAVRLAIELGCDSIQFKAYRNTPLELDDFQKHILDSRLHALKEIYKEDIVITGSLMPTEMTTRCFLSPIHILIDSFSDVFLCCYFRHRQSSHKIGNIIQDGFNKVWFSDRHWEIIKNVDPKECAKYDCKFFKYNFLMQTFMVDSRELDII